MDQTRGDQRPALNRDLLCAQCGARAVFTSGPTILAPAEVRGIREERGMSRADFGHATGLGEVAIAGWEDGLLISNTADECDLRLVCLPVASA